MIETPDFWRKTIEFEVVNVTHLMLEVNNTTNFAVFFWLMGHGGGSKLSIMKSKKEYNEVVFETYLCTGVQHWWTEEKYISAKLDFEQAKRHLYQCLYEVRVEEEKTVNENLNA